MRALKYVELPALPPEALGVRPRPGKTDPDLRDIDGVIRREEIFDGDDTTHQKSRKASDGVEHGFLTFGEGRELISAHCAG